MFQERAERRNEKGDRGESVARHHRRTRTKTSEHIPFCGTRIWEFEFADRVVCRMRIKRPIMRIIGVVKILDIRLHESENDLFATEEGIIEHSVLVDVTFAGDGLV